MVNRRAEAETPAKLAALRIEMRDAPRGSAACDTAGLCRALEAFYLSRVVGAPAV